ncbi:MAG: PAS domain-containing sensor histidine kinase [Gammaproteobacteria bacterium]|nr:PAS domain-containing sensor histidine kinase [Gammaproteobacteria bacterium]MBQ0839522.1 PAS domain-containing sensor histidine kinase [Gammaproteobacteria bacterium]
MTQTAQTTEHLEKVFETFNRVSQELDTSYRVLQVRVSTLTLELAEARSQRLQELAEKERLANRLALLMSELPGGVVVVDGSGVITQANAAAETFFQQVAGTTRAVRAHDAKHSLLGQAWPLLIAQASRDGGASENGTELLLGNGRRLSVSRQPLPDANEELILLTDMTRLHDLQETVSRDKRLSALGEMAARLAHQIRTPLSSALLYVSHLARPSATASERQRVSAKVVDSLRHMEGLVNSMLTFVRGGPVVFDSIELHSFTEELLALVEPLVNKSGGVLATELELGSGAITLEGDRDELIGAVLNLVNNAIDVADKPLHLDIKISAVGGALHIAVADNGPGVEPEIRERIFDPFFTTRVKGTGLGLAVVAMTVRSHGGKISLDTRADGGSVFCLDLPLKNPGLGQAVANPENTQITLFDGAVSVPESPTLEDAGLAQSQQNVAGGLQ